MPVVNLHLDGDGVWPDMKEKEVIVIDKPWEVAVLTGGMKSGLPSVALRLDLPDGRVVFTETSMRMFLIVADTFRAKFGDVRHE